MPDPWRVGRHVPHHVYRGDGHTVADEVAVTHRPEDAAQIVADHNALIAVAAQRDRYRRVLVFLLPFLQRKYKGLACCTVVEDALESPDAPAG